jgi:hypothetical protein
MLLAHFTPAEIPGTLAVLLIGVVLGVAIAKRSLRMGIAAMVGLAVFAGLASLGDSRDWSAGLRLTVDLTAALILAGCLLVQLRRALPPSRPS